MRLIATLAAAAALSACSATGSGMGAVTTSSGSPAGAAQVHFTTDGSATAQVKVTMPDREVFVGSAISGSRQGEPGVGFVPGRTGVYITSPGREWTGEVVAALRSSAGRTMRCKLQEKHTGLGLEGGAIGQCVVSDGRRVLVDL